MSNSHLTNFLNSLIKFFCFYRIREHLINRFFPTSLKLVNFPIVLVSIFLSFYKSTSVYLLYLLMYTSVVYMSILCMNYCIYLSVYLSILCIYYSLLCCGCIGLCRLEMDWDQLTVKSGLSFQFLK